MFVSGAGNRVDYEHRPAGRRLPPARLVPDELHNPVLPGDGQSNRTRIGWFDETALSRAVCIHARPAVPKPEHDAIGSIPHQGRANFGDDRRLLTSSSLML
jgi:hypothetical protein